ncbi:MAG: InlB B-repeat-containing protein [Kiritimatiellae bacterium]|nr:InlB B-repeat-containing protein [Kiritimatiellia bacterium]
MTMKRGKTSLTFFALALVFAASALADTEIGNVSPAPWRQADFAADLYRNAAASAGADSNVILSPWGVASLFGMLQTGARGDTAREIAATLRLGTGDSSPDETAETFRKARSAITAAAGKDVALELSDSLWLAPGFAPQKDFLDIVRDAFCAEARTTTMGETGRRAINGFVAEKTHGRIPNLLAPASLDDPLLRMVAVDTIYLKAKWNTPFDAAMTDSGTFRAPSGAVRVPFMRDTRDAEILDTPECAALRLPYRGRAVEMLVILPSPSNTLADVESQLGTAFLELLDSSPWSGTVSIKLPKFNFDSTHNLRPMLSSMGMASAFSATDADFSGIAPDIYISQALQKANVTVDEEGTEASAATAAIVCASAMWPLPKPRAFVADRPFLFLIRETGSGIVLFIGRVTKPECAGGQVLPYKVKFNANGGKLPKGKKMAAQTIVYGKAAKLRKNVFTRSGYVFAGWATSKANAKKGVIAYVNAQKVKNLRADGKTTTLYAVWAKPKYKVAFYANGGKGKTVVQTLKYGKAAKLAKCKFKAPKGKKFAGWATSKAKARAGKVKYRNKAAVKNLITTGKTVKLYAVWK